MDWGDPRLVVFVCLNCVLDGGSFPRKIDQYQGLAGLFVPWGAGGAGAVVGDEGSGGLTGGTMKTVFKIVGILFWIFGLI